MHTNSLAFPNMFSVSRNVVNVLEDDASIVNRCRLLLLSDPTALYNSPTFGAGLKRFLFQYNSDNTKVIIKDRIKKQLDEFEPCVLADETQFSDGLLYSGSNNIDNYADTNKLTMTVGLKTSYGNVVSINTDNIVTGDQ